MFIQYMAVARWPLRVEKLPEWTERHSCLATQHGCRRQLPTCHNLHGTSFANFYQIACDGANCDGPVNVISYTRGCSNSWLPMKHARACCMRPQWWPAGGSHYGLQLLWASGHLFT
jgi:hypothetical protein